MFPDAYFVFSTLAQELTDAERGILAKFVLSQRNNKRGPVLVLLGQDLFDSQGIVSAWRDCDDTEAKGIADRLGYLSSFRAVCEASTKLRLGIDPTRQWPNVDDL